MRKVFILLLLAIVLNVNAQDEKTVTLTVTGEGKTKQEARTNALRNAIEQAYGTFISSNTKVMNDSLIKDEIVSVTNGNIQKFDVISELQMPNGNFNNLTKATVSITKLTTFCINKGIKVEFKGSLFAENIKLQELNEKNEKKAVNNLIKILNEIQKKCFDYSLKVFEPLQDEDGVKWNIKVIANVTANDNLKIYQSTLIETLKSIAMTSTEIENYEKVNKKMYKIKIIPFNYLDNEIIILSFRNEEIIYNLNLNIFNFLLPISNFSISNGVSNLNFSMKLWRSLNENIENMKYKNYGGFKSRIVECRYLDGFKGFMSKLDLLSSENHQDKTVYTQLPLLVDYMFSFILYPNSFTEEYYYSDKVPVVYNFSRAFKNEVTNFEYIQQFSIDEIKQITEYKITPNDN